MFYVESSQPSLQACNSQAEDYNTRWVEHVDLLHHLPLVTQVPVIHGLFSLFQHLNYNDDGVGWVMLGI
jgi:hypothetical protein